MCSTEVISKKVFGTDGVRGRANQPPMTVEIALSLGRAAGQLFRQHNGKHRIVIGKDTRLSCYMFENALIAGLCSMGIDTLMVGPLPTPGVAYITRAYRADAGIVISASHNPYHDNGIKFFTGDGFKLPDEKEQEIEQLVHVNEYRDNLPEDYDIGKNTKIDDATGRYIEFIKSTFPRKLALNGIKVALDCANGAAYKVAPLVFHELGADLVVVGDKPNGLNINKNCGALYPEKVKQLLLDTGADIGIALDGDGDRLIIVDERGNIIDGDGILAICARDMQKNDLLINNRIVTTVMSNYGFFNAMDQLGIEVIKSQVGDRYVIQDMLKHHCNLGGEQSGHLIFLEQNTTGDGLVSALQLLRIMKQNQMKLSELAAFMIKYPQVLVNVKVKTKPPLKGLKTVEEAIKDAESELADSGRILVRYSGTEKICRVMVEGPDESRIKQMADKVAALITEEIGE